MDRAKRNVVHFARLEYFAFESLWPVNIREVAKQLGIGKSTVANALSGKRNVSEETRAKVLEKARQLGYEPNTVLSSYLQMVRTKKPGSLGNIALLHPIFDYGEPNRSFQSIPTCWQEQIRSMADRSADLGYNFDKIDSGGIRAAQLNRILSARGVVGLIIGPLRSGLGHITLDWSRFAAVAVGYTLVRPALHRVCHNHGLGMALALRNCRRKGYKRIGLVLNKESDRRSNGFWLGAYTGDQIRRPKREQVTPLFLPELTADKIQRWIRAERVEAAIFHATGHVPKIPELYNGVSGEVGTILLDRDYDPLSAFYAGIDQQFRLWGAQLVEQLSAQLVQNLRGLPNESITTLLPPKWREGRSLPEK